MKRLLLGYFSIYQNPAAEQNQNIDNF